jgi:ABC-type phosphate transport system permease subunit
VAKLNYLPVSNRFRVSVLLGVLFLVIGVSLLVYSISAIQDNGLLSNSADWTLKQMWHYDGSIRWWRNASFTLFLPLIAVFMTLGGVILVSHSLLARLPRKSVL